MRIETNRANYNITMPESLFAKGVKTGRIELVTAPVNNRCVAYTAGKCRTITIKRGA